MVKKRTNVLSTNNENRILSKKNRKQVDIYDVKICRKMYIQLQKKIQDTCSYMVEKLQIWDYNKGHAK